MGFGAEVAAVIQYQAFDWLDAPIERVGSKFTPLPFAPVMENFVVPHAADVLEAIRRTVRRVASEVTLPRLGQGMESGTIVRWLKSEGDQVEKGEPLYELDTDKVTQEVEAEASRRPAEDPRAGGRGAGRDAGRVRRRGGGGRSRQVSATQPAAGRAGAARSEQPMTATGEARRPLPRPQRTERLPPDGGRVKASPLARRIARERGIDLASARPAPGPRGGSSPRTSSGRRSRRARDGSAARRRGGRGRARRADLAAQDDRPADDRGVDGARLPDLDVGGHDPQRRSCAPGSSSATRTSGRP